METYEKQPLEVLQNISDAETLQTLTKANATDVLNILLDAINSISSGLIITDLNGIIRYANPAFCRLFDYANQEIIGKNAADLFAAKAVRTISDVMTIIDINAEEKEEFIVEDREKKRFVVEVAASAVISGSGRLIGRSASFVDITHKKEIEAEREQLIKNLQEALSKIRTLKGLLPICASCKKIRNGQGAWIHIEEYVVAHSDANFTHGICPDCSDRLYGENDWYKKKDKDRL